MPACVRPRERWLWCADHTRCCAFCGRQVDQPTHPAFYREDDERHHVCNVCRAPYTCPPPTRFELMQSFTGAEIAALLEPSCIISAADSFSYELVQALRHMSVLQRSACGYDHWVRGAYLITAVEADEHDVHLEVRDRGDVEALKRALEKDGTIKLRGRTLRVRGEQALEGHVQEDAAPAAIIAALDALDDLPATVVLGTDEDNEGGSDHIAAVNLTRPIKMPPKPDFVTLIVDDVASKYPGAAEVDVVHYLGGPCNDKELACCVVPGGAPIGWAVVQSLEQALTLAHSRAMNTRRAAAAAMGVKLSNAAVVSGGQSVTLQGLKAKPELNGEQGIALLFDTASGRWDVRLRSGEGYKVKPDNLVPGEGPYGRVFCFWGDAQWSRTQLLGEIARGHWGLCRAITDDVVLPPSKRWAALDGRAVYAPVSEMTDDMVREAARIRRQRQQREETDPVSAQQRADVRAHEQAAYTIAEHQMEEQSGPPRGTGNASGTSDSRA